MPDNISQTVADIKNLAHLILRVPFMVILKVLLCIGLTSNAKAARPAINGKSIIMSPVTGSNPIMLKSFGFAASSEITVGSEPDFNIRAISKGNAPMVFDIMRMTASITIYLQKLFLPVNADSRWFMILWLSEFSAGPLWMIN